MIDTDKYEGHTSADEWRLVFKEVNPLYSNEHPHNNKQMLGLRVKAYHLGQMQACDYEDYLVAQANQDLARDTPLLLAEVKRLRDKLFEAEIHIDPLTDDYTFENNIRELHYIEEVKE